MGHTARSRKDNSRKGMSTAAAACIIKDEEKPASAAHHHPKTPSPAVVINISS